MKRFFCILLVFLLLLPLAACNQQEADIQDPVNFYYRKQDPAHSDAAISRELGEAYGHREDYPYLIDQYLKGPTDEVLQRTFPTGISVVDLKIEGRSATLMLSDFFSTLSGLDLTLACACLTLTVCELTGTEQLTVRTQTTLLDGNKSITMAVKDIVLLDDCRVAIEPN